MKLMVGIVVLFFTFLGILDLPDLSHYGMVWYGYSGLVINIYYHNDNKSCLERQAAGFIRT